ncbi:MAG: histidine phosphatase family protein [Bryobacteraceae bacterium]
MQIYLIRHGQAGSRDNYDLLSETGKTQARLLGEYFHSAGIRFQAVYAGAMRRQQETAALVLGEMKDAPPAQIDPRWNEFSLEGLWEKLAPRLMGSNPEFARNYELLHAANPRIDRVMTVCDVELIRAWIANHHECEDVEPWPGFRQRVEAPRPDLARYGPGESIAVFTSATPTAIWCGAALGVEDRKIFQIAGVLYNSSFSTIRLRDGAMTLFSLNNTPHLLDEALRTFR